MALFLKKILWYPKGSSKSEELLDIIKIDIRSTMEAKASTCDITLVNPIEVISPQTTFFHGRYVDINSGLTQFNEGDTFKIFLAYSDTSRSIDDSDTSYDLIMIAELAEFDIDLGENTTRVILKCVDKTYSLLNRLWPYSYDNNWRSPEPDSLRGTAPVIIRDIVRQALAGDTGGLLKFDIEGRRSEHGTIAIDARFMGGEYPQISGTPPAYIQTRRPTAGTVTGAAEDALFLNADHRNFPFITMAKVFKPLYEWIKDLSSTDATNTPTELSNGNPPADRNYVFYVDQEGRFHWFYPEDSARTTLSSNITASSSTIPLASTTGFLDSGVVQIDSELIRYTGIAAGALTGLTRAFNNTTATSHSSGATVTNSLRLVAGDISTGHIIIRYKLTKKTFDVINMVIFNAGADLNGSGILDYFYDESTKSKELKMTYKPMVHMAKDLIKQELPTSLGGNNNLTQNNAATSPFTYEGNRYDNTAAYPFTTSWGSSVTSDSNYNTSLRTEAIIQGDRAAEQLTKSRGSPRWKGTIELAGRRYSPGDLITFTSYQGGIVNQDLRIKEVQHNIGKEGWFTTITVEEDQRRRSE